MTTSTIKAVIAQAGGPEFLLGFRFANGYKLVYSQYMIDLANDFVTIDGVELLKFHHKDTFGATATSYLEISEVSHIYFRDDASAKISIRDFME